MTARQPTVLLVDDDPDLLRLLSLRLQSTGFRIQTASSGEEALAMIERARPQAVVTDLRMAGMDGLALFDRVHRQDPALPVIVLTAHGTIPDAVEATQHGVFGYLTKPYEAKELIALLRRAIALLPEETRGTTGEDEEWRAGIITASPRMETLLSEARLVARSDASVLIQGESGTGKEVLARAIHLASGRQRKPFVAINCGAIPEPLLESELFGHAKGSFTGAISAHKGLIQAAEGGTVFLDEIGDMPPALQVNATGFASRIRRLPSTAENRRRRETKAALPPPGQQPISSSNIASALIRREKEFPGTAVAKYGDAARRRDPY